jgi:histidinol phosphatase-like enzyme (inositol monophosphatase family)
MPLNNSELRSTLDFALDATWQAGRITLSYFQTGVVAERKGDNTPVTIADREAEKRLRELIGRYSPESGIIGEEYGEQPGTNGQTWIIDPIDGTKSFIHGVPLYGCLLALVQDGQAQVGIAHFPALNETLYASRGGGCYWNGRRARVSSVDNLQDATLLCSDFTGYRSYQPAFEALVSSTYIQRTWGDSYGYFLVATGRAEIMLDPYMAVWDCGPFGVIMEEAGGTFTDWNGTPTIYGGSSIGTNGVLFDKVMAMVRWQKE